jgi:hypothetical protein
MNQFRLIRISHYYLNKILNTPKNGIFATIEAILIIFAKKLKKYPMVGGLGLFLLDEMKPNSWEREFRVPLFV